MALALGFDRAGVSSALPSAETRFFREWIARGYSGEMDYLDRRVEERVDPRLLMTEVKSIVAVGLVYREPGSREPGSREPGSGEPGLRERTDASERSSAGDGRDGDGENAESDAQRSRGAVAAYAGGDDYHDIIQDRLRALTTGIEALAGRSVRARAYVDTGPVLERVFAARAGLGWIGKNTCLIDPQIGSQMFLGVVLCDVDLAPDRPLSDRCGTCTACLDACPTGAFRAAYVLDATRCISYSTIEARGAVETALRESHGARVFGCDVCQDVCPWNQTQRGEPLADPLGLRERLRPRPEWDRPPLAWILALEPPEFAKASRGTALRRSRWRGLLRNALIAAGNAGDPELRELLERHACGPDPMLAEHARWALARLSA